MAVAGGPPVAGISGDSRIVIFLGHAAVALPWNPPVLMRTEKEAPLERNVETQSGWNDPYDDDPTTGP